MVATFKRLFPTAAPHGHFADDADQPLHIRWWRLRRSTDKFDKRGLASYNKAVAAAQAEARPLLDQACKTLSSASSLMSSAPRPNTLRPLRHG